MASPTNTGGGSQPDGQINTEPFQNTNPFVSAEQEVDHNNGNNSEDTSNGESENSVETPSEKQEEGQGSSEGSRPNRVRFGVQNRDELGSKDEMLEKYDTAASEAEPTIVQKIKSAAAEKFHLQSIRATGPGKIFNPTTVRANIRWKDADQRGDRTGLEPSDGKMPDDRSDLSLLWRSRDNRKGRNSLVVPKVDLEEQSSRKPWSLSPQTTSKVKEVFRTFYKMCTTFPYWDMAFWSGWTYTLGSALFVIDGAFAWTVVAWPETEFEGEEKWGVPLLFFFGACFYQIGAVVAYFEAVNDGSFHGSAMRKLLQGQGEDQKQMLDEKIHGFFGHFVPHPHKHKREEQSDSLEKNVDPEAGWKTKHRRERPGSIYPTGKAPAPRRGGVDMGEVEEGETTTYFTWRWWPSWYMLKTHHVYEIGYVACTIQLFGVTLYGVTSVVILPGILDSLNEWQTIAAYWIPQIVAAACFLIASVMFMLETQEKWWKPEPKVLGWWIGFWSIVGSVGFELCAAFGYLALEHEWAEYHSQLSTTWGSAGYLIGSMLQWYEAVNKRPVAEIFNEPGEMKSYQVHPI